MSTGPLAHADAPAGSSELVAPEGDLPLAPLPKPATRTPPAPTTEDLKQLDQLLADLISADAVLTKKALIIIDEPNEALLPAAAERLRRLAERADKDAMKAKLAELLPKDAHKEPKAIAGAKTKSDDDQPPLEYLDLLLAKPEPHSEPWRNLVSVAALARLFTATASVEATRQLVQIYVRFGEFLRIDTQRRLANLQLVGAAALIETSRHPAPKVAKWASQQLRNSNLNRPSRLVQQAQGAMLADILRAYGFTRDPDLASLLISFAGSSQVVVRHGAREAIAAMGEVANWPLRDAFERIAGRRPAREWSWERCARELFRELDRTRLYDVLVAYRAGLQAEQQGSLDEMRQRYDEVLTKDPDFENAEQLATGYLAYARAKAESAPSDALDTLRRAHRLTQSDETRRQTESLLYAIEAEQLVARGIADQVLLKRAIELDPNNERATRALAQLTSTTTETPSAVRRFAAAGMVGLITALAALFLARRARTDATKPMAASDSPN
jgi:hypothetical protein